MHSYLSSIDETNDAIVRVAISGEVVSATLASGTKNLPVTMKMTDKTGFKKIAVYT